MVEVLTGGYRRRMRWWKWLGLAGLAGVAASGVVIARDERARNSYSPEDVRDRLHQRLADAEAEGTADRSE
jgi:hypothetical protein